MPHGLQGRRELDRARGKCGWQMRGREVCFRKGYSEKFASAISSEFWLNVATAHIAVQARGCDFRVEAFEFDRQLKAAVDLKAVRFQLNTRQLGVQYSSNNAGDGPSVG